MKKYIIIEEGTYIEESYKFENELTFENNNVHDSRMSVGTLAKIYWHNVKDQSDFDNYINILDQLDIDYWTSDEDPVCEYNNYIVLDSGVYIEEGYKLDSENLIFEGGNAPYTPNVWHKVKDVTDWIFYTSKLDELEIDYTSCDSL